jgi:glycine betaine catabolism B
MGALKLKGTKFLGILCASDLPTWFKTRSFVVGRHWVTPLMSMRRSATDKQLPIKIILFDSNRNQQSILYRDELDKWTSQNRNVRIIYTITEEGGGSQREQGTATWTGEHVRIDKSMIDRHLTKDEIGKAIFYICGPPGMLMAMQNMLNNEMLIPKERLKVEAFTAC